MPLHENYSDPVWAEELRRQAGVSAELDLLITIPSAADPVAGAVLAWRPRLLLLLRTRELQQGPEPELRGWVAAWPFGWPAPRLRTIPDDVEEPGLGDEEILPTLEREIRQPPARVGYLITGGKKTHSVLLTRHAQAIGSPVLHFESRFTEAGRPIPGTGLPMVVPAPDAVLRREALARARALLRDRSFDAAEETLQLLRQLSPADPGSLVELTRRWLSCCRLRDAMLFTDARAEAEALGRALEAVGRPSNQSPPHLALAAAARNLSAICRDISAAISGVAPWDEHPRLPMLVELLERGVQERRAGRRNHAALLYYRLLEACFSERLRVAYGLDAGAVPDSASARWPHRFPAGGEPLAGPEQLVARFELAARRLGVGYLSLTRPLGLLDQLVFLIALGDPALPAGAEQLAGRLRGFAAGRNQSIFAHGFDPVDDEALAEFEGLLGLGDARRGFLNLIAADGPGRGMLGRLRQLQQGPALADDGTLLGRWRRSDVVGQAAAEGMPPLFFLNLSNHPVACWSPAQLVAARALGLGEPADLPGGMPLVPAAAGEREVARLAEELLERLGEAKVELGGACVSGEFTLTATLLRLLQRCGVRCFAATTERQVRERIEADGSVKRESEFRFVRWREYPGG